jgi:hypothetical protein
MVGFEPLFEQGRKFAKGTVELRDAGTVSVTSGVIAVGDPSSRIDKPLARTVPPGRYPVVASVAHLSASDERRVAAAMVRFSDRPIVSWEPALPRGEDPATLEPGQYFGYGVDGGIACFADEALLPALDFDTWEKTIMPAIERADSKGLCAATEIELGGGNVVAFTTGAGDGFYVSFWGLDDSGQPVALVTEFRILGTEVTRGREILAKAWPGVEPAQGDFMPLFEVGRAFESGEVLRVEDVGSIDLPSGTAIAWCGEEREVHPLAHRLSAGSYPVKLSVVRAKLGKRQVELAAALLVIVADERPVRWDVAATQGVDLATIEENTEVTMFEGGEAPLVLADHGLVDALKQARDTIAEAVPGTSRTAWKCSQVTIGAARVIAVAAGDMSSGAAFWGIGASGAPVALVLPFERTGNEVTRAWHVQKATKDRARAAS